MSERISERLGISGRQLVSIVGAGGKSTLLHRIGAEVADANRTVILTTTTRVQPGQVSEPAVWSRDHTEIAASLEPGRPLFVAIRRDGEKVFGLAPGDVDDLFVAGLADVIVVEADGARRRLIKAPADHEPAIPELTTTVVVVANAAAIGAPVAEAAHRPERFASLAGVATSDPVTVEGAARVLLHPDGGRRRVPDAARLVYVVTSDPDHRSTASGLVTLLAQADGVSAALVAMPQT